LESNAVSTIADELVLVKRRMLTEYVVSWKYGQYPVTQGRSESGRGVGWVERQIACVMVYRGNNACGG